MEQVKYLIIGGGIAGTAAAETIRRKDQEGRIVVVSAELHRLYSRIMLSKPNFFLEKIPFEQIWLKSSDWYGANRIEFWPGKKATSLISSSKTVTLDDRTVINYEKLLLALGAAPRLWDIPGCDKTGIFYLRTLDDAKTIIAAVKKAKEAVAVGGGFISFEMCEMMRLAGLNVTLIMREPYYWSPLLDEQAGRMIENALERGGVTILRNTEVAEVIGGKAAEGVILKDGARVSCGVIIVGIGVLCPLDWVRAAGVATNRGILANEYLETGAPDVWTAGDVAEFNDVILGERVQLGNWVNAQNQGRIAGGNMAGGKESFRMVSFYTTNGFGITIAFVGDVRPDAKRSVIIRGSKEINSYARLLMQDGKLLGATLINRTQELGVISKIIEHNINLAGKEAQLSDPATSLTVFLI